MNIFISYRFTEEDMVKLEEKMKTLCGALKEAGHNPICTFWKEDFFQKEQYTRKQILEYSFQELEKAETVLVYVDSSEKSAGMLLEVGYAIARGKRIILVIKQYIDSLSLRALADEILEFSNTGELANLIKSRVTV